MTAWAAIRVSGNPTACRSVLSPGTAAAPSGIAAMIPRAIWCHLPGRVRPPSGVPVPV